MTELLNYKQTSWSFGILVFCVKNLSKGKDMLGHLLFWCLLQYKDHVVNMKRQFKKKKKKYEQNICCSHSKNTKLLNYLKSFMTSVKFNMIEFT